MLVVSGARGILERFILWRWQMLRCYAVPRMIAMEDEGKAEANLDMIVNRR
jgi:hypothetical protein